MAEALRTLEMPAPVGEVWAALDDFGAISAWAPDVDHSCLLTDPPDGTEVGVVRRVQLGRMTLLERIVDRDPPSLLAYRLEGLPPLVRSALTRWELEPVGSRTRTTLTFTIDAGSRPPQRAVAAVLARRMGRAADGMLAGLADHLRVHG